MYRRIHPRISGALIALLILQTVVAAQTPQPRPTEKPFLWKVEGSVPSYLYGTVHVPDARVLALPDAVRTAIDATDVLNTEIPLDMSTQLGMLGKTMLPPGQDLRKIAGEEVFARLVRVVTRVLGGKLPPGAADLLATGLAPMKPWAAMSQIALLEYLPDTMAGRQPLDAVLYGMATKAGKEVGGLETVDEQVAAFEAFTMEEQVQMLVSALDDIEKPRAGEISSTRQLVDLYLTGDLNPLAAELNRMAAHNPALQKKMITRIVNDRNTTLTNRIIDRLERKPARSYFFAVGALHYAGETGILAQLAKRGFKVTRLP